MISKNNYEIWFIDFLEGKLGDKETVLLRHFLHENPDLALELDSIKELSLEIPDASPYPQKSQLTKYALDDAEYFETACIDFIEGNGKPVDNALFLEYSRTRPEKELELLRFKQTIFNADESVIYPHKSKLYKRAALLGFYTFTRYIAALLFVGLLLAGYLNFRQFNELGPTYVQHQGPFQVQETDPVALNTEDKKSTNKKAEIIEKEIPSTPLNTKAKTPLIASTLIQKHNDIGEQAYLSPITKHIKPTALIFAPGTLTEVRIPVTNEEKKGLLASLFQGRAPEAEVSKAAKSFGNIKMAPSVLNLLGDISEDRITYSENNDGNVASIKYKSKLLSFSVPIKQSQE